MLRQLAAVAAWASLIYIAFATLSPISERLHLAGIHVEHVIAFTILGALFSLAYPRRIVLVCVIVLGSAALLEVLQLLTPDRHGRLQDAIEKIGGGAVGIIVSQTILLFEQAKRWFQA